MVVYGLQFDARIVVI